MTDPERLDLESASGAHRRRRCVGSVNLVRLLREAGKLPLQEPSPDAISGTKVHAAWAGESVHLDAMQAETLAKLQRMESMLVTDWAGNDEHTLLGREMRLWLHDGWEPLHSGQFDAAYGTISTRRILILDAKTLFGEVSPAETNDQLRELVALGRFNYPGCVQFTVAILQPWVNARPSVAYYDQAEAELALRLLRQGILDCADPDAPRTAGPWCRYCSAIALCEEARAQVGVTYNLAKRIIEGEFALPIGSRGAAVLDSIKTAETVLEALLKAYKALITAQPDAVPGWQLRNGNKVREITDVLGAYKIARELMISEEFFAAASLKIGPLEERLGKKRFKEVFEPVITYRQNAPMLVRKDSQREQLP